MTRVRKKNHAKAQLRIIGGTHRGRKLPILAAEGLRPTGDRMRETLFNWLMAHVPNSRCIDMFAGTGALGIEALSRRAKHCSFVELNRDAAQQIKHNLTSIGIDSQQGSVLQQDVLSMSCPVLPFNIAFVDPPFNHGMAQQALDKLQQPGWLAAGAWVYLEHEKNLSGPNIPQDWRLAKQQNTQQVVANLYQFMPN